ncbi:C2H2-type domain-containing protein [Mycena chlorophos]|uniref:C2H2-type domain-containing protein n=1 Tax=Mycena chlorophos TaxID=658473 RepID=A0A8H6S1W6_MYCCL|nr:C2H2-type domain-containing protein [Mycena chlorophos]
MPTSTGVVQAKSELLLKTERSVVGVVGNRFRTANTNTKMAIKFGSKELGADSSRLCPRHHVCASLDRRQRRDSDTRCVEFGRERNACNGLRGLPILLFSFSRRMAKTQQHIRSFPIRPHCAPSPRKIDVPHVFGIRAFFSPAAPSEAKKTFPCKRRSLGGQCHVRRLHFRRLKRRSSYLQVCVPIPSFIFAEAFSLFSNDMRLIHHDWIYDCIAMRDGKPDMVSYSLAVNDFGRSCPPLVFNTEDIPSFRTPIPKKKPAESPYSPQPKRKLCPPAAFLTPSSASGPNPGPPASRVPRRKRILDDSEEEPNDIADEFEIKAIRALRIPPADARPSFGFKILQQPQLFCTRCHHGLQLRTACASTKARIAHGATAKKTRTCLARADVRLHVGYVPRRSHPPPPRLPTATSSELYKASLPPPVDYANQPVVLRFTSKISTRSTSVTAGIGVEGAHPLAFVGYGINQSRPPGGRVAASHGDARDTDDQFRALLKEHSRGEYTTEMLRVLMALMREARKHLIKLIGSASGPIAPRSRSSCADELHATLFSIFTQILNHGNEDPLLMPVLVPSPVPWGPVRTVVAHEMELVMVQDKLDLTSSETTLFYPILITLSACGQHKQYLVEGHDSVMTFLYYNASDQEHP